MNPSIRITLLVLAAAAGFCVSASAADVPTAAQPTRSNAAPTAKPLQGMKRGTDAAGRSIERAEGAAVRNIQSGSERASAPVRRLGESLGRKLGGNGHASGPVVGPQGEAP